MKSDNQGQVFHSQEAENKITPNPGHPVFISKTCQEKILKIKQVRKKESVKI